MPVLSTLELTKYFPTSDGKDNLVLDKISITVESNEIVCVLGPSGCGKSTLLRIVAGLDSQSSGEYAFGTKYTKRHLAMVFQDYSRTLFPWYTVSRQLTMASSRRTRNHVDSEYRQLIIHQLGLSRYKDYYPRQLSGGLQQRVAIARALLSGSELLVLDEPFGSLDALSRYQLEDDLLQVRTKYGISVLMVTHDIDEAIYLSDKIYVMSPLPGRVTAVIPSTIKGERSQATTRSSLEAISMRKLIWSALYA